MSRKDQDQSKKILGLSVGVVAAVGFAGWNLTQALSPPPANSKAPEAATASPEASSAGAAPADGAGGVTVASAKADESELLAQEALLAPQADPFLLTAPAATPIPVTTVAASGSQSAGPIYGGPALPPIGEPVVLTPAAEKAAPRVEPAPELVGTLMGDRPTAVFQGEGRVILVSVGKTHKGWTVLSVSHGSALVKGHGRRLELDVLSGASTGVIRAGDKSEALPSVVKNPFDMAAPPAAAPMAAAPMSVAPVASVPMAAAPAPKPAAKPRPAAPVEKPLPGLEPIFVGTKPVELAASAKPKPAPAEGDDFTDAPKTEPILELSPLPAPAPGPAIAPDEPTDPGKSE